MLVLLTNDSGLSIDENRWKIRNIANGKKGLFMPMSKWFLFCGAFLVRWGLFPSPSFVIAQKKAGIMFLFPVIYTGQL